MDTIKNILHIENFFTVKAEDGLLLKGGARRPGWQAAWDNEGNEGMPDLDLRGQGSEQGAYASQEAGKHALCVLGRLLRRGWAAGLACLLPRSLGLCQGLSRGREDAALLRDAVAASDGTGLWRGRGGRDVIRDVGGVDLVRFSSEFGNGAQAP